MKMNPRTCDVPSRPPESHGDCIAACVRTLLDRDDVPHCFDGRPLQQAWDDLRAWLAERDKFIAVFFTDDHKLQMSENPNIPYILLHGTHRGDHASIFRDGALIHDPSWYRSEVTGPHSVGAYVIAIIGDLVT